MIPFAVLAGPALLNRCQVAPPGDCRSYDGQCNPFTAAASTASIRIPRYAYVANQGTNTVGEFALDLSTGRLTALGSVATGSGPGGVAIHPDGKFVYVSNLSGASISMYAVDLATGLLTGLGSVASAGATPAVTVVHPGGLYLYNATNGAAAVSQYSIDQTTGLLTPIGSGSVATGAGPNGICVHPSGKYVYTANTTGGSISMFAVGTDGGLTALGATTTVRPAWRCTVSIRRAVC